MLEIAVYIKWMERIDDVSLKNGTLKRKCGGPCISLDDYAALEISLRLKDSMDATVTVITQGPKDAEVVLREALALGCDEAILMDGDLKYTLYETDGRDDQVALQLKEKDWDLVITGCRDVQDEVYMGGYAMAEILGLPMVSQVEEVMRDHRGLKAKCKWEKGYALLSLKLPCVLMVTGNGVTLRPLTFAGINRACDAKIIHVGKSTTPPEEVEVTGNKMVTYEPRVLHNTILSGVPPEKMAAVFMDFLKEWNL